MAAGQRSHTESVLAAVRLQPQLLAPFSAVCFSHGSYLAATGKSSITKNIQHRSDAVHGRQLLSYPRL